MFWKRNSALYSYLSQRHKNSGDIALSEYRAHSGRMPVICCKEFYSSPRTNRAYRASRRCLSSLPSLSNKSLKEAFLNFPRKL
ncbi:hypothetical protein J6590_037047 [Homalodisca vitripennis]|nr:hypothetical protein J6590_037047 [Homalodisca vitripennis]